MFSLKKKVNPTYLMCRNLLFLFLAEYEVVSEFSNKYQMLLLSLSYYKHVRVMLVKLKLYRGKILLAFFSTVNENHVVFM